MALWNNPEKQARIHERQTNINAQKAWSSNPNIAAKGMLGMDIARMQSGNLGLSQAEQNQLSEASTQQAGAGLEAQNQEIAQQGLASGGGAGPSARYAALQRSMGRNLAGAQSQAQTEAARISQAKKLSEKQDIDARIAGQQAAQTQKNQFWANMIMSAANPAGKGAASSITTATG